MDMLPMLTFVRYYFKQVTHPSFNYLDTKEQERSQGKRQEVEAGGIKRKGKYVAN